MNLLNTHPKLTLIFTSEFVPKTGLVLAEYWAPCWKALASNVQYGLNKVQEEYNNGFNSIYLFKSNFLFSNSPKTLTKTLFNNSDKLVVVNGPITTF